jgi:dihydrodipicolinate synthase/N-acetylneuraminate lyase
MLLEGVFIPITTPFTANGDLYLRKLEHNVARYSRTQLAGMVVLGSTGEAVMLDGAEQRVVLETAMVTAAPEKVMIAGVGHESVRETIALAEYAATLNYDVVLARTPHYYRGQLHPTGRAPLEMLTYYRAVADHSPLPVLLYNVPALTQYDLPVEAVAELAAHPNIIGIKDSAGTPEKIAQIASRTQSCRRTVTVTPTFAAVTARMLQTQPESAAMVSPESLRQSSVAVAAPTTIKIKTRQKETGFAILTGRTGTLQESFNAGATGAVVSFAVCAPQCCYEIWAAWKEGNSDLSAEKQQRIRAAASVVASQMGVPGLKFACDLNGYFGGHPRLPLLPLNGEQQREVIAQMADIRY